MSDSLATMVETEMDSERLLDCLYGLKDLDKRCFRELVATEDALTIDELAERVDRERSTVYRAVQRLSEAGVIEKEQVNYDHGGYYHVYRMADPAAIRTDMQRLLNDWYAKMGQLIHAFEQEYRETDESSESGSESAL